MSWKWNLRSAEEKAEEILRERGLTAAPFCPISIARLAGITVDSADLNSDFDGCFVRNNDRYGILYSKNSHPRRARFTVAHELGHYYLEGHPEKVFKNGQTHVHSRVDLSPTDLIEQEANCFASGLLMPKPVFSHKMRDSGSGLVAIKALSETFDTSLEATAWRYVGLAEETCVVVTGKRGMIEHYWLSSDLFDLLRSNAARRGVPLPSKTLSSSFHSDPGKIARSMRDEGTCYLDQWLDGAPHLEMNEDVVGLGGYGKTLTVLWPSGETGEEDEHLSEEAW